MPAGCRSDIEYNVPPSVKEGIEFVYVENVREVLAVVFKGQKVLETLEERTLPGAW